MAPMSVAAKYWGTHKGKQYSILNKCDGRLFPTQNPSTDEAADRLPREGVTRHYELRKWHTSNVAWRNSRTLKGMSMIQCPAQQAAVCTAEPWRVNSTSSCGLRKCCAGRSEVLW